MVNPTKAFASLSLAERIGISQKTTRKMGHAMRQMMCSNDESHSGLNGIIELEEVYFGVISIIRKGFNTIGAKGSVKQCVLVAVQWNGHVRTSLRTDSSRAYELAPLAEGFVFPESYHLTEENLAHISIGTKYPTHSSENHAEKEYDRGNVHNKTVEYFSSILEQAKLGALHYMIKRRKGGIREG